MIRGLHGMFYTSEAAEARAFMRDKLRLPFHDVGGGWLIFDLPAADVGFHPADASEGSTAGTHDVSFFCDDIRGTVAELRKRGVKFKGEPIDQGYGWVTYFEMPGGIEVQLYEPKYGKRASKPATRGARTRKRSPKRKAAKAAKAKPAKRAPKTAKRKARR